MNEYHGYKRDSKTRCLIGLAQAIAVALGSLLILATTMILMGY